VEVKSAYAIEKHQRITSVHATAALFSMTSTNYFNQKLARNSESAALVLVPRCPNDVQGKETGNPSGMSSYGPTRGHLSSTGWPFSKPSMTIPDVTTRTPAAFISVRASFTDASARPRFTCEQGAKIRLASDDGLVIEIRLVETIEVIRHTIKPAQHSRIHPQ
jgi:hypothetical protein